MVVVLPRSVQLCAILRKSVQTFADLCRSEHLRPVAQIFILIMIEPLGVLARTISFSIIQFRCFSGVAVCACVVLD